MSDATESTGPGIYILDSCAYFRLARSAQSFLRDYVVETYIAAQKSGPSPADIEALAVAFAIPGIVVSDDKNLRETGAIFDIKTITSVDLLEKLLSDSVIDKATLQSIADYWEYDNDLPRGRHGFLDKIKALLKI